MQLNALINIFQYEQDLDIYISFSLDQNQNEDQVGLILITKN